MKIVAVLACLLIPCAASAADCYRNAQGKTVCANGGQAASYNARTGTVRTASQNGAGVTTTQSSRGGEAKTKNGKGVARGPGGTTCVKTANNQGCR